MICSRRICSGVTNKCLLHIYYQHFSKESKYLATSTEKRYPLLYIIINTINRKGISDIIYGIKEGNGASVRHVCRKVIFFVSFLSS